MEVELREECSSQEVEECGTCTTLHLRSCTISLVSSWRPVQVKRCTPAHQSAGCLRDGRHLCRTQYSSHCSTRLEYQAMQEDFPRCRRETVTSCPQENLLEAGCREVQVMRCTIEKRTVRKAKPVTSCRRIPRKMCAKKKCKKVNSPCVYLA